MTTAHAPAPEAVTVGAVVAAWNVTRRYGEEGSAVDALRGVSMRVPEGQWEGVITALIGAELGLPLGILLAAVITRALHDIDVTFALPVGTILVFAFVAMIAGTLAAVLPARRASRLNVLQALHYE